MAEVVSLGILVADILAKPVDVYPEKGKLMLVERMELHSGGHAANVSVSLSRIGIQAGVIGKVGDDALGDFMLSVFEKNKVDARGVLRDREASTSATMVLVHSDGERSFIHNIGANATIREEEINFELIRAAKVLYIAGSLVMPGFDGEPTARVLKRAKEMGLTTALDTVWDFWGRWMKVLAPSLPYLDIILPSIEEARMLTNRESPEEVASVLMDKGVKTVVLKMGERGCYIKAGKEELRLPAYEVEVMDTTGAGDAHTAGFLTGVVKGWDLEKTGKFANAVGALCCTAIGTTAGVKSMEETLEFMKRARTR